MDSSVLWRLKCGIHWVLVLVVFIVEFYGLLGIIGMVWCMGCWVLKEYGGTWLFEFDQGICFIRINVSFNKCHHGTIELCSTSSTGHDYGSKILCSSDYAKWWRCIKVDSG